MRKIDLILSKLNALSDKKVWLIFFAYALGISLLIQLVLLPYVFPQWHAGDGLITGGDFRGFHRIAGEQAATVRELGWGEFTLYPKLQFVSGVASFFYILFFSSPVVVLPLNAFLHASAGLLCFKIIYKLTENKAASLIGASLFVLFPSALRWVSQMHNENYAVLGAVMVLYGWVQFDDFLKTKTNKTLVFALGSIAGGLLLIGFVRDYLLEVYLVAFIVFGLYLAARAALKIRRSSYWLDLGWFLLLFLFVYLLTTFVYEPALLSLRRAGWQTGPTTLFYDNVLQTDSEGADGLESGLIPGNGKRYGWWEETKFIPEAIDDKVRDLIAKRRTAIRVWKEGSSGIDTDVDLNNSVKTLLYVPRALQIALLAPFPSDWFDQGAKAPSNFMKGVAALEMSFVYAIFLFLPYGLIRWRGSTALHLILIYILFFLVVFSLATPNVGNLYRFRYPFFMPLVSLAAASMCQLFISRFKLEKSNINNP